MSKNTFFHTRFWQDTYISSLDPSEKFVFIYTMTSPYIGLSGIYELPLKYMAIETGLDVDMLTKILKRFEEDGKVFYYSGWICVKNYLKYQSFRGEKLQKGLSNEINHVPSHILQYFVEKGYPIDRVSIPSMDMGMDMDKEYKSKNMPWNQKSDDYLEADDIQIDPEFKPKVSKKKEKKVSDDVQAVFDLFKNPASVTWKYTNLERDAAQALFDTYGLEVIERRLQRIEKERKKKDPFFPDAFSPSELLNKMPKIERYLGI